MTGLKQIRWTAIVTLVLGLTLAMSSGIVEQEAMMAPEGSFAHSANAMAARLFTVASIFILIWALEMQRAKLATRLHNVEQELAQLKAKTGLA